MNDRQMLIRDFLQKHRTVKNTQLADHLNVSQETIRRDLDIMEKTGILTRIHGGAYLNQNFVHETDYLYRETIHQHQKKQIAQKAVEFVRENQTIGLDVSTTNTEIALALSLHFQNLTIITNSIVIAIELSKKSKFTILMPGGLIRNEELCFVGESSATYLQQFHLDLLFMSFSGVSLTDGFTDYGFGEAPLKKAMIQNTDQIYAVGDSSKFNVNALLKICPLHHVTALITDNHLAPTIRADFESCGLTIFSEND